MGLSWFFKIVVLSVFVSLVSCSKVLPEEKVVIAVYPYWKHSSEEVDSLQWQHFSHITLFAAFPESDGSIITEHIDGFASEVITKAKQQGKKVILSIGGAGEASKGYLVATRTPEVRKTLVNNIVEIVKRYDLDGIDIDWEYWTFQHELFKGGVDPIESQQLVQLLAELRAQLPKGTLLTVDIMAGAWQGEQYQVDVQKYVDYVNLMAFDFTGAWPDSPVGHHSEFETFALAVQSVLERGFKAEKLIAGIPLYGVEFIGGNNKEVKHVSYDVIVDRVKENEKHLSSGHYQHLYFENTENVVKKSKYVLDHNLAGVFVFEVTSDSKNKEHSLVQAINRYLRPEG